MATTIRQLSEQISRLYARGVDKENNNTVLNWKEVKPLVVQQINNITGMTLINLNEMDVGVVLVGTGARRPVTFSSCM